MEPDKDKIIKMVQDFLEDPAFASLTKEELAILLYQDVVNPLFQELRTELANLAYKYGSYSGDSSH